MEISPAGVGRILIGVLEPLPPDNYRDGEGLK
jgi:hypothetical protein